MTSQDEELLADLLLRWEELQEQGLDTPASEIATDRPDLIPELDRRIRLLKASAWLDKPLDDDPPDDDAPGSPPAPRTLGGRYRFDEMIAEGGFARVYKAYDTELQRTVAVKIPKRDWPQQAEALSTEARRVARLKHEGIVTVFDAGVDNDDCYIVTEYVEGGSLADRIATQKPAPAEIIAWIADVANALEYAHLHGIIHRDIKPANILIDHNGNAKLTDFGISRSPSRGNDGSTGSLGTLWYMSPEHLASKATDHRSDIYSLAVVLHEALAGSPPYRSWEPMQLRAEILGELCTVSPSIPSPLRHTLVRALQKSPHQRHASASHFAAEIRKPSRLAAWSRGLLWPTILAAVAAVALSGWAFRLREQPADETPEDFRELMARATTEFFHSQYEDAEASFTKVLRMYPRNRQSLSDRGVCRMKLGRIDEAIDDFSAALVQAPHDHETLRNRSQCYVYLRQYAEAIADLKMVAENFPQLSEVPQQLATIYAVRANDRIQARDPEGAVSDLTRALSYRPDQPAYFIKRAECHEEQGHLEEAVADWTEAIKRWSKDSDLLRARAKTLGKLGRHEEAEADLRKAKGLSQ